MGQLRGSILPVVFDLVHEAGVGISIRIRSAFFVPLFFFFFGLDFQLFWVLFRAQMHRYLD